MVREETGMPFTAANALTDLQEQPHRHPYSQWRGAVLGVLREPGGPREVEHCPRLMEG